MMRRLDLHDPPARRGFAQQGEICIARLSRWKFIKDTGAGSMAAAAIAVAAPAIAQ
jgi:hypothetical protein